MKFIAKNTITDNIKYEYILLGLSLFALIFYTLCASPSLGWRDGPELVVTAAYLDVAHPAGFPSYNLLAKILTWLPLGSIGFRVTLFSALATGAAIFLLGLLIRKIHCLDKDNPPSLLWLAAGLPFFVLHQGIWAASVEVEVYSLNLLFMVGLLYCAASWFEGQGIIWLYFGGFLYGLACGNHASLSLYLPVLLLLTFWGQPKTSPGQGLSHNFLIRLLILSIIFIVGLSVYLLLIVRSGTDALPVDFGRTNTLTTFWDHITDAKDRGFHTKSLQSIHELSYYLGVQFENLTSPLVWLALPFMLWGLRYLWVRYQILSVALVLLFAINMVFFFYWIDGVAAFMPTILVAFLLMSLGLGQLGRFLAKMAMPAMARSLVPVLVAVIGLGLLGHQRFGEQDTQSGFWSIELFWPDLSKLPPESVAIYSDIWFHGLGLQYVYLARPDVSIVFLNSVGGSKYITPLLPGKFPMAVFPRTLNGEYLNTQTGNYLNYFLNANFQAGKPVYIQYTVEPSIASIFFYTKPDLDLIWLGQIQQNPATSLEAYKAGDYGRYLEWLNRFMLVMAKGDDPPLAKKAPYYLFIVMEPIIRYALENGEYVLTEKVIQTYMDSFKDKNGKGLFPYNVGLNVQSDMVKILVRLNRLNEAEVAMKRLVAMDPSKPIGYYLLGLIQEANEKSTEAMASIRTAMERDPYDVHFIRRYAVLLAKYVTLAQGVKFLDERSWFFASKGFTGFSMVIDDFRACLLTPPEDDGNKEGSLNAITNDPYRSTVAL
ncbi:MAG: DUF2723 domain-containing protein [Deltaproteobacteria bacterium]|jgi:hypothetical protein|nr:DUF2723 domain-containing protein [Deltaproteobacteria bacterium]